jgi:fructokinase
LDTLKNRHQGQVFLDVNLRAPWWQAGEVEQWLADADWVKLNFDELELLQPSHLPLAERMANFRQQFALQGLIVTQGEQGASAILADGEMVSVKPERQFDVVDCVGAGDAFSAVLMLGIAEHWPLSLTMERAQNFASALVGQRGATVLDRNFYKAFVDEWRLA